MTHYRPWLLSTLFVVPMTAPAWAQTTDAAATVSAMLNSYGPVPVTANVNVPVTRLVCHRLPPAADGGEVCHNVTVNVPTPRTTSRILEASAIRIVASTPVVFGKLNRTELPNELIAWDQQVINCGKVGDASTTVSISKQVQHSQSIATSKSVTNTLGGELGVQYGVPGVFSVGGKLSISTSNTSGTVDTKGAGDLDTRSGSATVAVPARSVKIVEMRVWPIKFSIPFTATVTVDASLSANDRNLTQLAGVFDAAQRTFPIEGTLLVEQASDAQILIFDGTLDERECPVGAPAILIKPAAIAQGVKLMQVNP